MKPLRPPITQHLVGAFVLGLLVVSGTAPAHAAAPDRLALAVGNGAYETPLDLPVTAAQTAAEALAELGFAVDLGFDLDKPALEEATRSFTERLEGDTIGFLYFAGHVVEHDGRHFLLPAGAEIASAANLEVEALELEALVDDLSRVHNELTLVVLEACTESPLPAPTSAPASPLPVDERVFLVLARGPCTEPVGAELTDHLLSLLLEEPLTLDQIFRRAAERAEANGSRVALGDLAVVRDVPLPPVAGPGGTVRGLAANSLASQSGELPVLWPPPRPTSFYPVPRELWRGSATTVGEGAERLETALSEAGYSERSYYAVPGGFALVTRVEQIEDDGRPKGERRWAMDTVVRAEFSLETVLEALRALFARRAGLFRLLVLVLTPEEWIPAAGEALDAEETRGLVAAGLVRPPRELTGLALTDDHHVTLLVYEIEKDAAEHELEVVPAGSSPRTALQHFKRSGLRGAVEDLR
jgi:hypothetical protein